MGRGGNPATPPTAHNVDSQERYIMPPSSNGSEGRESAPLRTPRSQRGDLGSNPRGGVAEQPTLRHVESVLSGLNVEERTVAIWEVLNRIVTLNDRYTFRRWRHINEVCVANNIKHYNSAVFKVGSRAGLELLRMLRCDIRG